ncbi:ABC transporter ATP-binding protein [Paenibacillus sp. YN15]|uniref:ABC transporter ATP-binding protein n=1 Tax=Paenibacillus sp. YN15 TaxID=1742774 RepID=UPI0026A90FA3
MSMLETADLRLVYGNGRAIVNGMSLYLPKGKVYSIIGPNGCGKSTLLRALSRQLKPDRGQVLLEGKNLFRTPPKEAARKLSFLAQGQEKVEMKVKDLVGYGRTPYRSLGQPRPTREDQTIVAWAMEATSVAAMAERDVATLSGGERQRVWIAMALAQRPEMLLLDEPTTYLDICHQMEVLELLQHLNREYGMTILMVLHDMNQACQFSDEIIVMKAGAIHAQGEPRQVMTPELLQEVFQVRALVNEDGDSGKPFCRIQGKITG